MTTKNSFARYKKPKVNDSKIENSGSDCFEEKKFVRRGVTSNRMTLSMDEVSTRLSTLATDWDLRVAALKTLQSRFQEGKINEMDANMCKKIGIQVRDLFCTFDRFCFFFSNSKNVP